MSHPIEHETELRHYQCVLSTVMLDAQCLTSLLKHHVYIITYISPPARNNDISHYFDKQTLIQVFSAHLWPADTR